MQNENLLLLRSPSQISSLYPQISLLTMKPYIETNGKKQYLPQNVDPHRFEVGVLERNGKTHFLLCPKVKTRYRQATGVHIETDGNEFVIPVVSGKIVKRTFPLEGLSFIPIQIDWQAGAPVTITHEVNEEETAQEAPPATEETPVATEE